jgi:hypothetical protein
LTHSAGRSRICRLFALALQVAQRIDELGEIGRERRAEGVLLAAWPFERQRLRVQEHAR